MIQCCLVDNDIVLFLGPVRLIFYLMSDCYLGFDQQYDIFTNIKSS